MRHLLLTFLVFNFVAMAHGHEMKAFANRHVLPEGGGKVVVFLSWGHRLPVDELVDGAPLDRYELISPEGSAIPLKKEGVGLQENQVECKQNGLYTLVVGRKTSIYTHVLDEEGTRLLKRGPKNQQNTGKVEAGTRYRQAAKSYIGVGVPVNLAPKPLGLVMEITPTKGPANWKQGNDIPFQVLLDGKPVPTADVQGRFVGFKPDDAWCYATETDRAGNCVIRPSQAGVWVLKAQYKKLAQENDRLSHDFESSTATLTLEILP